MGGEYGVVGCVPVGCGGSSPRGRGIRPHQPHSLPERGLIPAWAGNTLVERLYRAAFPAHPRVGGEYHPFRIEGGVCVGSSPRGRGIRQPPQRSWPAIRLIPAWAGNTSSSSSRWSLAAAHPRVGGEYTLWMACLVRRLGSSPRGRGIPDQGEADDGADGLIPAWAGNTLGDLGVYPGSVPFWYDFASSWRGAAHRGRRARC